MNPNRSSCVMILKTYGILNKKKDYRNVKRMLRFCLKTFLKNTIQSDGQASSRSVRKETY